MADTPDEAKLSKLKKIRWLGWLAGAMCVVGLVVLPGDWGAIRWLAGFALLAAIISSRTIREMIARSAAGGTNKRERSLTFVATMAVSWALADALIFGQGLIGFILCLLGVLSFLPRALAVYRERPLFSVRLGKASVVLVSGAAAIASIFYGNQLTEERANTIVAAVEQYNAKNGRYPERLSDLAPEFLPAVPAPRFAMMKGNFRYMTLKSGHSLMYVEIPPFGRRMYTFEEKRWSSFD